MRILINLLLVLAFAFAPGSPLSTPDPQSTTYWAMNRSGADCSSCAFVQGESVGNAAVSSIAKAFDSNNTAGNWIVAGGGQFLNCGGSPGVITDSGPNTYSTVLTDAQSTVDVATLDAEHPTVSAANTVTLSQGCGGPTGYLDLVFAEFSGFHAVDQSASGHCSSCAATMTTPSITIGKTEMVVSYIYDAQTNHNWSVPAGWTICSNCVSHDSFGTTSAMAYQLLTPGTYSLTWTNLGSLSGGTIYIIASFK